MRNDSTWEETVRILNVTEIYGDVEEEHAELTNGGFFCDTEKNPRRKILTDPAEVGVYMRKHMHIIYKHQKNLTPQAEHVVRFLGSIQDQEVLNALQSKEISNLQQTALEGKLEAGAGEPADEIHEELKCTWHWWLHWGLG